jgi:hypothetical protein
VLQAVQHLFIETIAPAEIFCMVLNGPFENGCSGRKTEMAQMMGGPDEGQALLSSEQEILLAHLRMRQYSMRSALEYMQLDLEPERVSAFLTKKFKSSDGFFAALADTVHAQRKAGTLPDVRPPARPKPRSRRGF